MDIFVKILNVISIAAVVLGLFWVLLGGINFFQSRKNKDKSGMDEAVESMIYGALIGPFAAAVVQGIIAAIQAYSS